MGQARPYRPLRVRLHFKDWHTSQQGRLDLDGRRREPALIGEGDVDPAPCIQAMRDAGYSGYINFEYEGEKYDPWTATRKGVALLADLIERSAKSTN